jgi:GWxTD domain-containing protein
MSIRFALWFLAATLLARAAEPTWLDRVAPIITTPEKKAYLALSPADRWQFEEEFFDRKAVTAEEYYQRFAYIDNAFGSGKTGSGANTDQGRVRLSLGAPAKITRIPSSRIFVPMEIWYYNDVPGILNTELRLIFYRPNTMGFPKLYSPTTDTIRALLPPQSSTVHMFGPNDTITESSIRQSLMTGPAEDEIITASVGVASGIRGAGNDEILGEVSSPSFILGKARAAKVTSKLIPEKPALDIFHTASPFGGSQIDLALHIAVQRDIGFEVVTRSATLSRDVVHLNFPEPRAILYAHRLDLLPGSYRLIFTLDGVPSVYPLEVPQSAVMGEIMRVDVSTRGDSRRTPFEFGDRRLALNPAGPLAAVSAPTSAAVTWIIRQGPSALWKSTAQQSDGLALIELPSNLAPGEYRLEAHTDSDSRTAPLIIDKSAHPTTETALSYNANLSPSRRLAFVGRQRVLLGDLAAGRRLLEESLAEEPSPETQVELARAEALAGDLDMARERVKQVIKASPRDFEALSVYAYIETRLQDYPVAADLYKRALSVQDSPALRAALARLP